MKAVLLGSGGWIPTQTRETCCVCLRTGSDVLFLDAGTGLRHAVEHGNLLAGARSVQIVLSHFHLDHVVGLGYLPALELPHPPVLWGPGRALYGAPTRHILGRMLESPFFTPGLDSTFAEVADLEHGENNCGAFTVRTRRQSRHSEPTFAFRVDGSVSYCSDTASDEENVAFAEGSVVLFHEAWAADRHSHEEIHTSAREAGRIAYAAGVDQLVLIHVHPLATVETLEAAARMEFEPSIVGSDLLAIELE